MRDAVIDSRFDDASPWGSHRRLRDGAAPAVPAAARLMQSQFGADRYEVRAPLLRSGVTVARLRTRTGDTAVDSAFVADTDILKVSLSSFRIEALSPSAHRGEVFIAAGSACLIEQGVHAHAVLPGGAEAIHIHIPRASLEQAAEDQLEWSFAAPLHLHIGQQVRDPLLEQLARRTATALDSDGAADRLYADTLAGALLAHLLRHYSTASTAPELQPARGGLAPRQLRLVTAHMRAALEREVPLAELAAMVDLSVHHFCRAFKQSTGQPPHAWMTSLRVERIKALLAEPALSLTEIALMTGYSSQSAMGAAFRRATGETPSAWRRAL